MGLLAWFTIGVVALTAIVLLVVFPGLWLAGVLALAAVLIVGIGGMVGRGATRAGDTTPDIVERRREHEARRSSRRRRAR